jgi:hypothetical protein
MMVKSILQCLCRGLMAQRCLRLHHALTITVIALTITVTAQDIPDCDPASPLAHGEPSTSPDGRFTVYADCYASDQTAYTLYAYDTDTDKTRVLGTTAPDLPTETLFVSRWLDDTTVAIRAETGGGTYNWRSVYLADVTVSRSLTEIARDYVSRPRFGEEPLRYEWAVEDGITETYEVRVYDVEAGETEVIYTDDCLLRDDLENELSCHMVTPHTNADFTEDGDPTRLILNIGDSAREIKTVEIRALPDGDLLYTVDALGMGYAEWIAGDTAAVFNLAFDFETGGFGGVFLQIADDGRILLEEPFALPNGEPLTQRPSWLESDDT